MSRSIREIVKETAESKKFQIEWDRQLATAEKIVERHEDGLGTVLLADEVGMGKTYVALTTIATHVFQSDENDRKVLLVVPPNNILAHKWEQEIRTFNEKYLVDSICNNLNKRLRPMVVTDYWDLIRNLHNFENQKTPRVSEGMLQCFARVTWHWNNSNRAKNTWKREWAAYGDINDYSLEYLSFCSWYSPRAIAAFLDEKKSSEPSKIKEMVGKLNQGDLGYGYLPILLKEFGKIQDFVEANVFVIGMATLRTTRIHKEDSKLLSTYIASFLLKGRREDTKKTALKKMAKHKFCFAPPNMAVCGNPHFRWFVGIGSINLWGMESAVQKVIEIRGGTDQIVKRVLVGDDLDSLLIELQAHVINLKLSESGIGLAVVDEVHNWKGGGNGAKEFKSRYAPHIPNKLIMSATPFQLHQDELGRVFEFASGATDKSIEIVNKLLLEKSVAKQCLDASDEFFRAWKTLSKNDHFQLQNALRSNDDISASFRSLHVQSDVSESLEAFLLCIEKYRAAIGVLRDELSKIIIRHTKNRDKRHFHAGIEYSVNGVPDYSKIRRTLYAVPGYGDSANGMLNFIAMRVDQLVRRDTQTKGYETNAHLLGGITSSNQAFIDSNSKLMANDEISPTTKEYLRFFANALDVNPHPKVAATVASAFENFKRGQKTLIFCERLGTQKEIMSSLEQLVNEKIFTRGGIAIAKKERESILKDHKAVELFLSRSCLMTLDQASQVNLKRVLLEVRNTLIATVTQKIIELGGKVNQRQVSKLMDLAMLKEIGAQMGGQSLTIGNLFDLDIDALKYYLRMRDDSGSSSIEDQPEDSEHDLDFGQLLEHEIGDILDAPSIWYSNDKAVSVHKNLWRLLLSETHEFSKKSEQISFVVIAGILLDLGQGLRKILLRLDLMQNIERTEDESLSNAVIRLLGSTSEHSPWNRTHQFVEELIGGEGTISRKSTQSSKRQSLWRGVFLREERIVSELNGSVAADTRVNICAAFNSPLLPDILVCTAIGSEGIDLHRYCANVIHHDLPWNPAKLEQRTGRVDRVGSLAELQYDKEKFRLNIGIPFLAHNYENFQYEQLLCRAQKFEILLGKPDFAMDVEDETVMDKNGNELVAEISEEDTDMPADNAICLPDNLIDFLKMDLSVYSPPFSNVT